MVENLIRLYTNHVEKMIDGIECISNEEMASIREKAFNICSSINELEFFIKDNYSLRKEEIIENKSNEIESNDYNISKTKEMIKEFKDIGLMVRQNLYTLVYAGGFQDTIEEMSANGKINISNKCWGIIGYEKCDSFKKHGIIPNYGIEFILLENKFGHFLTEYIDGELMFKVESIFDKHCIWEKKKPNLFVVREFK